jgi:hypothetical protein
MLDSTKTTDVDIAGHIEGMSDDGLLQLLERITAILRERHHARLRVDLNIDDPWVWCCIGVEKNIIVFCFSTVGAAKNVLRLLDQRPPVCLQNGMFV